MKIPQDVRPVMDLFQLHALHFFGAVGESFAQRERKMAKIIAGLSRDQCIDISRCAALLTARIHAERFLYY